MTKTTIQINPYNYDNVCAHPRKTTMMMQSSLSDLTKQRMLQAKALSKEAKGGECTVDALVLVQSVSWHWDRELTCVCIIFRGTLMHILVYILRQQMP